MDQPFTTLSVWNGVAEIAAALQRGDGAALSKLYDFAGPRLLRYAEALTKNRADAEDVLQSAIVRIARKPELFASSQKPWAYLIQIVRNEALKLVSRRKIRTSLQDRLSLGQPAPCPVEQAESREQIQDALSHLPREQAEVVVLKIWEDFTFAEIADLVAESPNTVASRYRYALEKLSHSLQPLAQRDFTAESEVRHV